VDLLDVGGTPVVGDSKVADRSGALRRQRSGPWSASGLATSGSVTVSSLSELQAAKTASNPLRPGAPA